jgi:hypothetical protein
MNVADIQASDPQQQYIESGLIVRWSFSMSQTIFFRGIQSFTTFLCEKNQFSFAQPDYYHFLTGKP